MWFPQNERHYALQVATYMMLFGCAASFLMTRYCVALSTGIDFEKNLERMLLIQAIIETVVFVLIIIFFKSMYFNRWGQNSVDRDDLSDLGDIDYEFRSPKTLTRKSTLDKHLQISRSYSERTEVRFTHGNEIVLTQNPENHLKM